MRRLTKVLSELAFLSGRLNAFCDRYDRHFKILTFSILVGRLFAGLLGWSGLVGWLNIVLEILAIIVVVWALSWLFRALDRRYSRRRVPDDFEL